MKKPAQRAAALALSLALIAQPTALASLALGDDLHGATVPVAEDTTLSRQVFWSNTYSDLRTEHYFTYTPNDTVIPVVAHGSHVLSKSTLTSLAQGLTVAGGRVAGGVNGDYFVVSTGQPTGLLITEGVVRSSSGGLVAIGFQADGTALLGQPQMRLTAAFGGGALAIAGVNKVRTATGGIYLLTSDFSPNTQNTMPGLDVILTPSTEHLGEEISVPLPMADTPETADPAIGAHPAAETALPAPDPAATTDAEAADPAAADPTAAQTLIRSDVLRVNSRVTCTVDAVAASVGSVDIPAGKLVLTINDQSNAWLREQLATLQPGDTVELDLTCDDPAWTEVEYAVGGLYRLVSGGTVTPGLDAGQAPRSAVGVKADGSVVFYTIDGRNPGYSIGASLTQVANRLVELGCVDAICLDGGGSTTLGAALPGEAALSVENIPSDFYQRAVTNAIFLVSSAPATGHPAGYSVTPYDCAVLAGASLPFSASAYDSAYHPLPYPLFPAWWTTRGGGSITASGVFTAGDAGGLATVTANSDFGFGSASVLVVETPDAIRVADSSTGVALSALALSPGQVVDLTATALYRKISLTAQDTCFTWTLDESVGTVDEHGVLTAGDHTGSGLLAVSAGERSAVIPVSVTGHILPLEDFEGDLTTFVSTDTTTLSLQGGTDLVRYGDHSLRLDYVPDLTGSSGAAVFLPLTAGEKFLNFWVYGNRSSALLAATFSLDDGSTASLPLTTLDFTGWQAVSVPLPQGAVSLAALRISETGGNGGTILLDHFTTSNELISDLVAPTISLTVENRTLTAAVSDNVAQTFDESQITVLWDGAPLSFAWDDASAVATAPLPTDDGLLHRVSVTAADVSGNLARWGVAVTPAPVFTPEGEPVPTPAPFPDTEGHWSETFTTYLFQQGVTNGVATAEGVFFQPDRSITRGEFSLMVARWLGLDLTAFESVSLPFRDAASIPDWALPGVKAMYALGLMQGSRDGDALNANANAPIRRAEAITLLGRIQPRGYATPDLTFTDAATVPVWALPHVSSLWGQGTVSGSDGLVRPLDPVKRGEVAKLLCAMM